MKLSIVIGTLNRLPHLQKCIASAEKSCGDMEREIIVVDGGSYDGTQKWLANRRDIITIEQGAPYGAVCAFNAGFWASEGDYVAGLNDDCVVVGNTLPLACEYLDAHPETGQVAIPWRDIGNNDLSVQHVTIGRQYVPCIYANFGVTRRTLGDAVGWWGTWEHYAGDCELSFAILDQGYFVDELAGGAIEHSRVQDYTRRVCYHNNAFMKKWYGDYDAGKIERMMASRNGKGSVRPDSVPE